MVRTQYHVAAALVVGQAAAAPAWPTFNWPTFALPTIALPTLTFPTIAFPTIPIYQPTTTTTSTVKPTTKATTKTYTTSGPTLSPTGSTVKPTPASSASRPVVSSPLGSATKPPLPTLSTSISQVIPSKPSSSASKAASSASKPVSSPIKASSAAPPSSTGYTVGQAVDTTSGTIIGHPAPNAPDVSEYLGIRFGQAPVGDLRFAPPRAYRSTATYQGASFGADCPALPPPVPAVINGTRLGNVLGDLAEVGIPLAEDCLFANVWTKPQAGSAKKPVLVWIYGGGFSFGATNVKAYNGKYFADQEDVVLVSFNYRTNILGFSGAPGLTQNVGLLDQRLAIEWVRDNIAAFGGDPSRITLFGQSAGGMSIDLYNYAYLNDPIIKGTILHSGNVYSYAIREPADAADAWYTVSTAVGCGNATTSTPEAVLTCMRSPSTTFEALEKAANTKQGLASLLGNFGPTNDGQLVYGRTTYAARAAAGNWTQLPTLVGNTNKESALLILIAAGAGEAYPQDVWDTIDLTVFVCPAAYAAANRVAARVPVWRYWYAGAFPNLYLPTANASQAWHTGDIPTLFGTSGDMSGEAPTDAQVAFGNYIRGAWAAFAADPAAGLSAAPYSWPQYDPNAQTLIRLGQNNATTAEYGFPKDVDVGC